MGMARSRLTRQGQISVPALVRRKLGVGPGSVIQWEEKGSEIVVRKAGDVSLDSIRRALGFSSPPPARSLAELKAGVTKSVRARHAGR